ncbi:MAG: TolC family protein [Gammaproteobacteria bacterium]|nr:TolC family protein [Gammaproteobacteria bacterium]
MLRHHPYLGLLSCLVFSGCMQYHAAPLAVAPHYASLTPNSTALQNFPTLKAHPFNPDDGLDVVEIEMLAVSQNPALQLARSDLGVSQAQAYAAGLLPDPQLSLASDISHASGVGAASSYGLNYDFGALLAHSSAKHEAEYAHHQAELNLLWQEWQVIGQAQLLMVRAQMQAKIMQTLQRQQQFAADRAARSYQAMQQGNVTRDIANSDVVALQAINSKIDDLKTLQLATRHDINDLLGISPNSMLNLQFESHKKASSPRRVDPSLIRVALDHLAERRPDLQALQAGYASQDAKFHRAILAQFPALNVGLTRNKDNAGLVSNSLGITLTLPIFNHNQGNVAIEQATRQRMHDEYQIRLNQTHASVLRLQSEQQQQFAVWQSRRAKLTQLRHDVDQTSVVYHQGLVDDLIWVNLNNNEFSQELDLLNIEQAIREQSVGLNILLGLPVSQSQNEETVQ